MKKRLWLFYKAGFHPEERSDERSFLRKSFFKRLKFYIKNVCGKKDFSLRSKLTNPMFYFSNIINKHVHDVNDELLGRLTDVVVETNKKNFPPIVGIVVFDKKDKRELFVPSKYIASWSTEGIALKIRNSEAVTDLPIEPELLLLQKNIVDKQIVDLAGVKVVRVNDLQFGSVRGEMSLLAIDVSSSGLLRRLGISSPMFNLFKPHLLEWKNVHLIGDKLQLGIGKNELIKLHPADIANIVERLNLKQGSLLLKSLDEVTAAKVMEEIQPEIQKLLVQHLGVDRSANIMSKMSTDELVDLIQLLPAREARRIVDSLPINKDMSRVKKILEYDEDEAGGLMTTEYVSAGPEATVKEVIQKIREHSHQHRSINFVYVLDNENKFLGVASLRRLLIAKDEDLVGSFMKKTSRVPGVKVDEKISEIAEKMTKYNLLSVAVLDDEGRMLGVVTIDDIMRCLFPEA